MKTGMLAAEAVAEALAAGRPRELAAYPEQAASELAVRGAARRAQHPPGFAKFGLWGGLAYAGARHAMCCAASAPWTLHHAHPDHETLMPAAECQPIDYPKPDGMLTFDRLSSVFISNTNHEENQPAHLTLRDPAKAIAVNWRRLRSPETRYCPAGVYEIVGAEEGATAAADQRAELRALQDLRHQGPAPRTSTGSRRKAAAGRIIRAGCSANCRALEKSSHEGSGPGQAGG